MDENPGMTTDRVRALKQAVAEAKPTICPERALMWTEYFKGRESREKHIYIQMADVLAHVLARKTVAIYPRELIVGNFTSKRVGGMIQPELHGILSLLEISSFPTRRHNPLAISPEDMRALKRIRPFWLRRNLPYQTYASPLKKAAFLFRIYRARDYMINELGGIAHFAPDYPKLLRLGADGIAAEATERQKQWPEGSDEWSFYEAAKIVAGAISSYGERYAEKAAELAQAEPDPGRKAELETISRICKKVPRSGAETFHEALQSIMLAQIGMVNEALDVTVCPGRMDQYLFPYYQQDLAAGRLTREQAKELLACFTIKLCEFVPVFGKLPNRLNSGLPGYQTVVVGGQDRQGRDAVNELSYIFLELMDELRMRQPNYHARLHANSPQPYLEKVFAVIAAGANSPALYNDEVIIPALLKSGYQLADARDYTPIGCVEPGCQGKSFSSTDAALFNTPVALELALNEGKRFGSRFRAGAKTMPVARMRTMDDLTRAFLSQLQYKMTEMIADLKAVERANAKYHPTPLSSMLLDGCLQNGKCSTRGGAVYNFSGVQCVAPADTGDALYALEKLAFTDQKIALTELVAELKSNLKDEAWRARLRNLAKFGNDDDEVDRWTKFVIEEYVGRLAEFGDNTRGGRYVTGLYSITANEYFGKVTAALPSGRRKGEPFASGIAPENGMDKKGPTAVLNSMNRLDFTKCRNGINFNLKFQSDSVKGNAGRANLQALMRAYFERGGMQAQINVLDAETLKKAKANPELYPNLLVRVSGYSAYFNDLTEEMKDEIIQRTSNIIR